MKKLSLILCFFYLITANAQVDVGNNLVTGTVDTTRMVQNIFLKNRVKVPVNALVFNIGYSIPVVMNSLLKNDCWKGNKKTGAQVEFSVDYRKQFFHQEIDNDEVISYPTACALGVGLGFSYITKSIGFDLYSEILENYKDVDGDFCDVSLEYKNVKEKVSLYYLDVPLYLEIGKLSRVKISGFFKIGVKNSLLVAHQLTAEGTFTSTGYYRATDCTLHNIDALGYYTNSPCYFDGLRNITPDYHLNRYVLWGSIAAGINIPFSSLEKNKLAKCILRLGAKIDYTITPVGKKIPESWFEGTNFRLFQSNLLGGNGTRILSPGVTLSLIYCL